MIFYYIMFIILLIPEAMFTHTSNPVQFHKIVYSEILCVQMILYTHIKFDLTLYQKQQMVRRPKGRVQGILQNTPLLLWKKYYCRQFKNGTDLCTNDPCLRGTYLLIIIKSISTPRPTLHELFVKWNPRASSKSSVINTVLTFVWLQSLSVHMFISDIMTEQVQTRITQNRLLYVYYSRTDSNYIEQTVICAL